MYHGAINQADLSNHKCSAMAAQPFSLCTCAEEAWAGDMGMLRFKRQCNLHATTKQEPLQFVRYSPGEPDETLTLYLTLLYKLHEGVDLVVDQPVF